MIYSFIIYSNTDNIFPSGILLEGDYSKFDGVIINSLHYQELQDELCSILYDEDGHATGIGNRIFGGSIEQAVTEVREKLREEDHVIFVKIAEYL